MMHRAMLEQLRDQLAADWQGLAVADRLCLCAFLRRAARRDWESADQFLRAAEQSMAKWAIDWVAVLKVLEIIATILAPLLVKDAGQNSPKVTT